MPDLRNETDGVALVREMFAFWQERLSLRDVVVSLRAVDSLPNGHVLEVEAAGGGEDTGRALVEIVRSYLQSAQPEDLHSDVMHELFHVVLWPFRTAVDSLALNHLSRSQHSLLLEAMRVANEGVTYKMERALVALVPMPDRFKGR